MDFIAEFTYSNTSKVGETTNVAEVVKEVKMEINKMTTMMLKESDL